VNVEVVNDDNAFLSMKPVGSGSRVSEDQSQVVFNFPDRNRRGIGDKPADVGLGRNSTYEFLADSADDRGSPDGLLDIANQGSEDVVVYSKQIQTEDSEDNPLPLVSLYDPETEEDLTEDQPSKPLGTGEDVRVGMRIRTREADAGELHEVTLRIVAERQQ